MFGSSQVGWPSRESDTKAYVSVSGMTRKHERPSELHECVQ